MNGLPYSLVLNHRSKRLKSFSMTTVIEQYTARGNFCNFFPKQRLFAYPNPPYSFPSPALLPTSYSTICSSRQTSKTSKEENGEIVSLLHPSPLPRLRLHRRKPPTGVDPVPIHVPGDGRRVRIRRRIRHGFRLQPPNPRHQPVHQLRGPEAQQRPLLPPRRLLLQLPPRRSGQPLPPRLQRHHSMP